MQRGMITALVGVVCLGAPIVARSESLPSDVRAGHWAASAVPEVLNNHVMSLDSDGKFHGDRKVTQVQAVIALSRLAHALEQGQWKPAASRPLSASAQKVADTTDWRSQPVRRYTLAVILARFGDYVANGLPRPAAGSQDLGKSIVLGSPTVKLAPAHPAYTALVYLAKNRMIQPGSPLLTPDNNPIQGALLSRGLAEMAAGLNDRLTPLGKLPDGTTPDASFHKPKPK